MHPGSQRESEMLQDGAAEENVVPEAEESQRWQMHSPMAWEIEIRRENILQPQSPQLGT
jgi:hypothetical protein